MKPLFTRSPFDMEMARTCTQHSLNSSICLSQYQLEENLHGRGIIEVMVFPLQLNKMIMLDRSS